MEIGQNISYLIREFAKVIQFLRIFLQCVWITYLICQAVEEGPWKMLRAGRLSPYVSRLMFADDLLLFGSTSDEQMDCVI
jgi:hypothetical protein